VTQTQTRFPFASLHVQRCGPQNSGIGGTSRTSARQRPQPQRVSELHTSVKKLANPNPQNLPTKGSRLQVFILQAKGGAWFGAAAFTFPSADRGVVGVG
jgi:hypothetical protein